MKGPRRNVPAKFKAMVALQAAKKRQGLSVLSDKHEVHANMVSAWKRVLFESDVLPANFEKQIIHGKPKLQKAIFINPCQM